MIVTGARSWSGVARRPAWQSGMLFHQVLERRSRRVKMAAWQTRTRRLAAAHRGALPGAHRRGGRRAARRGRRGRADVPGADRAPRHRARGDLLARARTRASCSPPRPTPSSPAALDRRSRGAPDTSPQDRIRTLALGVFDAIDEHPGSRRSSPPAPGRPPRRGSSRPRSPGPCAGVPEGSRFTATSVLMQYILGVGGQNAANARDLAPAADRGEFLGAVSRALGGSSTPTTTRSPGPSRTSCASTTTARSSSPGSLSSSRGSPPSTRLEESTCEVRAVDL